MSTPYFHFKQFTVHHDLCAMKVGTDGVLLGAWTPVSGKEKNILDIGTGSGLIALMLAQRCTQAHITGLDIEESAIKQAEQNFCASQWSNRLKTEMNDIQSFAKSTSQHFDLIVSNPPFFNNSLRNPQAHRSTARHTDTLSYEELFQAAACLLTETGLFCCILPASEEQKTDSISAINGFFPHRKTYVIPKLNAQPKRILMAFAKTKNDCVKDSITLEDKESPRSAAYRKLTEDFYL